VGENDAFKLHRFKDLYKINQQMRSSMVKRDSDPSSNVIETKQLSQVVQTDEMYSAYFNGIVAFMKFTQQHNPERYRFNLVHARKHLQKTSAKR